MPRTEHPSLARWIAIFAAADAALIAFVLIVLWASNGFQGLGIGGQALIALILGSTGTAAVGIVLMGLVFYSNRTGQDAAVYHTGLHERARPAEPLPDEVELASRDSFPASDAPSRTPVTGTGNPGPPRRREPSRAS